VIASLKCPAMTDSGIDLLSYQSIPVEIPQHQRLTHV
jgi:hypothetical protein